MAKIVGGIATSHAAPIGFALDTGKANDPVSAPIVEAYEPVRQWLEDKKPDVLLLVYNDHVTSFFFDHYSHFALGIGPEFPVADSGGGPRVLPPLKGHPKLAQHIAAGLVADEFDLSYFQGKGLDHGAFAPLSLLWPHEPDWPGAIVPLQVGVLQFPIPSARRCFKLGKALRKAILSYPDEGLKVAIVGAGGPAHQLHGERAGFNNTPWDKEFMELLEKDPEKLTQITIAEYAKRGGLEGSEVIMWLIMRGALARKVKKLHEAYLPSMTPIATLIFEDDSGEGADESVDAYRKRAARELDGIEKLEGYPFTLDRSVKAYRLNAFLHHLNESDFRKKFLADPEPLFEAAKLTEEERDLVRRRDWRGLNQYGAIFFMLEKLGAVVGTTNLHIYEAVRGS